MHRATGIVPNTMTKLSRDEKVTFEMLGKICDVLKVDVGDIVDIAKIRNNRCIPMS